MCYYKVLSGRSVLLLQVSEELLGELKCLSARPAVGTANHTSVLVAIFSYLVSYFREKM